MTRQEMEEVLTLVRQALEPRIVQPATPAPTAALPRTGNVILYRSKNSDSIVALRDALTAEGVNVRRVRDLRNVVLVPGDLVVAWGEKVARVPAGVTVYNAAPLKNKKEEMQALAHAGVNVPNFTTTRPTTGNWLKRTSNHQSASDLRNQAAVTNPAFWVTKVPIAKEFRIHVFSGESIRSGLKVKARNDAHEWIRSVETGWKIDYGARCQAEIRQTYRDAAKAAVRALGLTFGAVDLGVTPTGGIIVFEVNTAPALANPETAKAYARRIRAAVRP